MGRDFRPSANFDVGDMPAVALAASMPPDMLSNRPSPVWWRSFETQYVN